MSQAVYDYAHQLARALKNSDEYQKYWEAKNDIMDDEIAQKTFQDFRQQQLSVHAAQLSGNGIAPEEQERMEKLYEIISLNPKIKAFLEAETRVITILADIEKILTDNIELWSGLEDES